MLVSRPRGIKLVFNAEITSNLGSFISTSFDLLLLKPALDVLSINFVNLLFQHYCNKLVKNNNFIVDYPIIINILYHLS